MAISLGVSFAARAFAGDRDETKKIFRQALSHDGYALIDVFQPCVSFNKVNTFAWFKAHTYYLGEGHNPRNRGAALERALESEKLPLGLFYLAPKRPTFEKTTGLYDSDDSPLHTRTIPLDRLERLIASKRT